MQVSNIRCWLQSTVDGLRQLDAVELAAADARMMETGDMSTWEWSMQQLISSEAQAKAVRTPYPPINIIQAVMPVT